MRLRLSWIAALLFAPGARGEQPVDYARLVARDFLRGFQPFRTVREGDVPVSPWLFAPGLPRTVVPGRAELYRRFAGYGPVVDRPVASWLTGYQHLGHTPGPLLAACAVVALLASAGLGRARRSGLRVAAWMFASLCLVALFLTEQGLDRKALIRKIERLTREQQTQN